MKKFLILPLILGAAISSMAQSSVLDIFNGATNLDVGITAIYAPKLSDQFGATVFVGVPVSERVETIIRADYLMGNIFLVNGSVTFNQDIKVFGLLGKAFVLVGTGTAATGLGNANADPYGITGAGVGVDVYTSKNGKLTVSIGGDYERWTGANLSFDTYRGGVKVGYKF